MSEKGYSRRDFMQYFGIDAMLSDGQYSESHFNPARKLAAELKYSP